VFSSLRRAYLAVRGETIGELPIDVNFGNILQKGTLLTGGATQFAGEGKRLFKLQLHLEF